MKTTKTAKEKLAGLVRVISIPPVMVTALLLILCVYLLQEQNLHATARQLFIHRNTLVYRLQRIRTLLQLDLDDAAVRNVLRTGCILLEYYQGAF